MKPDIEHLIWLYSVGLNTLFNEQPVNLLEEDNNKTNFLGEIHKEANLQNKSNQLKYRESEDQKSDLENSCREMSLLSDPRELEIYYRKLLSKNFNLGSKKCILRSGTKSRNNLIVITETPSINDFNMGRLYSGEKKVLLDAILVSFKYSLKKRDLDVILAPASPFPAGAFSEANRLKPYQDLYLYNLIRIIEPILIILIGGRSAKFMTENSELGKENGNYSRIPYFAVPELEYIINVPKTKEKVWKTWKDFIKRGNYEVAS